MRNLTIGQLRGWLDQHGDDEPVVFRYGDDTLVVDEAWHDPEQGYQVSLRDEPVPYTPMSLDQIAERAVQAKSDAEYARKRAAADEAMAAGWLVLAEQATAAENMALTLLASRMNMPAEYEAMAAEARRRFDALYPTTKEGDGADG